MSDTTTKLIQVCSANGVCEVCNSLPFDNTKLQTLDRRVGADELYLGKEWFEKSLKQWDGIPVIYHPAGEHPSDFKAVEENPEKAARAIGGTLVGSVRNPHIEIAGGPRLMASLDITEKEDEIHKLWEEGKLFPSTAWSARTNGDELTSPVIPNHVLLFPEVKDKVAAGDPGAYVFTTVVSDTSEDNPMTDEKHTDDKTPSEKTTFYDRLCNAIRKFMETEKSVDVTAENTAREEKTDSEKEESKMTETEEVKPQAEKTEVNAEEKKSAEQPAEKPADAQTEAENTDTKTPCDESTVNPAVTAHDAEIAELHSQIEALKAEVEKQRAAEAARMKTEADKKFSMFLDSFVPAGMKATEKQVSDVRAQYDADPVGLMFTIKAEEAKNGTGITARSGVPYVAMNSNTKRETVGDLSQKKNNKE